MNGPVESARGDGEELRTGQPRAAGGITSRELVRRALRGQSDPRAPTGPLAGHFCGAFAGYSLRQYTSHARLLAESVVRYYERFKPDAIWVSADTWVSA